MRCFIKNKKFLHIVVILTLVLVTAVGVTVSTAAGVEPGTADDPVVSQSYVDAKVNELSSQINELKQQIQTGSQGTGTPQTQSAKYQVIGPVPAGKKIIAGESTEIILRGGSATAIGSEYGGVADLIAGTDLQTGTKVPLNHLLLVPRSDGRGISITSEAWVLVRGSYSIN